MSTNAELKKMVTLEQVMKCCFVIAQATKVTPNLKARNPSYLLNLKLSPALDAEHHTLYKKLHYTSSAQITFRHPDPASLKNTDLLALINFPRKQIGSKMSDCLVTGVMPMDGELEVQKTNIVCVRPWMEEGMERVKPGTRVGIIPTEDALLTSNPRNLSWEEFTDCHILVGRVLSASPDPDDENQEPRLSRVRLEVEFGGTTGKMPALAWFRRALLLKDMNKLVGVQVLAVVNLAFSDAKENTKRWFEQGVAAVLTVNGQTVLEPALEVIDGYRLA